MSTTKRKSAGKTAKGQYKGYRISVTKDGSEWLLMIEAPDGGVCYDDETGFDSKTAAVDYAKYRIDGRTLG